MSDQRQPPVVMIHGVGLDHTMWTPVADRLADHLDVFTFDLAGHGSLRNETPSMDRFVEQVMAVAPGPVVLVGFSLGALIAQEAALRHPSRVSRLVAVSGVFRRSAEQRAAVVARVAAVRAGGYADSVESAIARWFSPEFSARDPQALEAVRTVMAANLVTTYATAYEVFATADDSLATRVSSITCPVLAVTGADDPGSTPAMTRALAQEVAQGHACVIDGARHLLPLEAPEVLAIVLTNFLNKP